MLDQLVIERILPVTSPFLMVDSVTSYQNSACPKLITKRKIRSSDPFHTYGGESRMLPSVYIIEGLAQTAILLSNVFSLDQLKTDMDIDNNTSLSSFINANLDTLHVDGEINQTITATGLLALVDIEITGQVFRDDLLLFEVEQQKIFADKSRYGVKAFVGEDEVAHGFLIGSRSERIGQKQ